MSKEAPENSTLSSAAEFRRRREAREGGELITLTSGLTVRLKRPAVDKLIAQGIIPSDMVQRFMKYDDKAGTKDLKPEDIEAGLQYVNIIVTHAFVEPTVKAEPNYDNNEIALSDLEQEDMDDVMAYVKGGLKAVELFREERTKRLLSRPTSEAVSVPQT